MRAALCLALAFLAGAECSMEKMKAHLDQWNWDTACWGEGNVVTMKKMMKGVCEECMKLPKNEFPAHALRCSPQTRGRHETPLHDPCKLPAVCRVPVRPADAQHAQPVCRLPRQAGGGGRGV